MSAAAADLIRDLSARGVRFSRNGDRLRVEAPPGTLTPELRQTLTEAKPEILAALGTRDRLLALADVEGIDPALVHALTARDLADIAEWGDDALRAYVRVLRDDALHARGWPADDETAAIRCMRCGQVVAAPEVARVLPVVDGVPTAIGCPWCRNRKEGLPIPRPAESDIERPALKAAIR
jgi:hypothetical protein